MNSSLNVMSDGVLIKKTESLVVEERALLTSILHHLREINRRRLFSALGFKSLFEFAVKKLGYSEDRAYRRIAAMKMLKELPELAEKLNSGKLSLMHISVAHSFFHQERKACEMAIIKKNTTSLDHPTVVAEEKVPDKTKAHGLSKEEKIQFLEKIKSTSIREAERIALSLSSNPHSSKADKIRLLSETHIEIKFQASIELKNKIEKLKGLLAHSHPQLSLGELFEKLCDLGLSEFDPNLGSFRKRRVKDQINESKASVSSKADLKRKVWRRAENQCELCQSTFALEIDHQVPRAKGGTDEFDNFQLLCRNCNQRAAIEEFGIEKMGSYIN